jgi:hypothetical protein
MTFHCLTVLHLIIYTVDRLGQGLQHQGRRIEDRLTVVVVVVVVSRATCYLPWTRELSLLELHAT